LSTIFSFKSGIVSSLSLFISEMSDTYILALSSFKISSEIEDFPSPIMVKYFFNVIEVIFPVFSLGNL